ncbi:TPR domain-containing protein [Cordyceps javanica]|uniref:TPR domain-containing protein n=1 Tax=Cordyceps javanica TaxID=43265 RepID=A0A545VPL4_9HYPO|nr:TPR domain-containing protein [Cordyceps javanica]TQW03658.1 TPR domain protein [Cordyceps javanica]
MSSAFLDRFRAFMRQPHQPQVPVERFLDSAHTVIVERTVQRHFDALYREGEPNMAAQFLNLELQLPSKRARLCSRARKRLRSRVVSLTTEQLADVSSLEDSELLNDILRLAPESGEESYGRSMAFVKECLSQPMTESLTMASPPSLIGDFMLHQICTGSRVFLGNLVRSVIINHLMFHLDEFLAATTEVVPRLPTFSATLGEEIAGDLAADLRESFREKNEEFLKDAVLRKGDAIIDRLVEQLLSSDTSAKIVKRISGLSPQARKALATKHSSDTQSFTEEEFALISSGKYSWVKELRELRVSDRDVTKLLLQEHHSTPWAFDGDLNSDDVSLDKDLLLDNHLISCAHNLLEVKNVDEASSTRYDLYANVADVVDTWGPAELLCASSDQGPFAMRIGGGILYTEDANGTRYHWSKTADLKNVSRSAMDPTRKLLIGAVRINDDCQSSYEDLREHASLQTLGTQGKSSSKFVFDNLSLSIGGIFRVAAQASIKHNAGISHKEVEKGTAQDDVMSLVDYRSAVQVSYCTGICRRVRFRDMVADLLPAFGPSSVRSEADALAWQRLLDARIVDLLRGDGDVILEAPDLSFFRDKVKEMYDSLFHSGMKSDMKLRVAWPSAGDRLAYSAILCSGGANAWAEILCESTRISTYAYIAPHCLQAVGGNPSACHSGWAPAAGLSRLRAFATKVQCVGSLATVADLFPGSMCFFVLMRKMVFAQVHRSDGEPVTLRVVLQTMPASARRRLVTLCYRNGSEMAQLQESRAGSAARAEDVLIECAPGG